MPLDTGVDAFELTPLHVLRSLFNINSAAVASWSSRVSGCGPRAGLVSAKLWCLDWLSAWPTTDGDGRMEGDVVFECVENGRL